FAPSLRGYAFPSLKAGPPLAPREFHQKERLDRASRLISSRDSRTVKNGAEGVTVLERAVIAPCRVIARPSDLIRGRRPRKMHVRGSSGMATPEPLRLAAGDSCTGDRFSLFQGIPRLRRRHTLPPATGPPDGPTSRTISFASLPRLIATGRPRESGVRRPIRAARPLRPLTPPHRPLVPVPDLAPHHLDAQLIAYSAEGVVM